MSVSDADLELLESHLDGELSTAEEAALRHRLASEHVLDQELTSIRAERALRAQVFGALEPDDQAVKNLIRGVRNQITKESVRGDRMRILRYIASAAACVMLSFSAGWLGKARVNNQNTAQVPLAQQSPAIAQNDGSVPIHFADNPGLGSAGGSAGGYPVNLTDAFGHVVAVQHFDTLNEAREFTEDVGRWQRQQQQIRGAEPVVYKDKF